MSALHEYGDILVMLSVSFLFFCGAVMYKFVEWIGALVETANQRTRTRELENDKLELENTAIEMSNDRLELENEKLALELSTLKHAA
jgi:hypothetical protein